MTPLSKCVPQGFLDCVHCLCRGMLVTYMELCCHELLCSLVLLPSRACCCVTEHGIMCHTCPTNFYLYVHHTSTIVAVACSSTYLVVAPDPPCCLLFMVTGSALPTAHGTVVSPVVYSLHGSQVRCRDCKSLVYAKVSTPTIPSDKSGAASYDLPPTTLPS